VSTFLQGKRTAFEPTAIQYFEDPNKKSAQYEFLETNRRSDKQVFGWLIRDHQGEPLDKRFQVYPNVKRVSKKGKYVFELRQSSSLKSIPPVLKSDVKPREHASVEIIGNAIYLKKEGGSGHNEAFLFRSKPSLLDLICEYQPALLSDLMNSEYIDVLQLSSYQQVGKQVCFSDSPFQALVDSEQDTSKIIQEALDHSVNKVKPYLDQMTRASEYCFLRSVISCLGLNLLIGCLRRFNCRPQSKSDQPIVMVSYHDIYYGLYRLIKKMELNNRPVNAKLDQLIRPVDPLTVEELSQKEPLLLDIVQLVDESLGQRPCDAILFAKYNAIMSYVQRLKELKEKYPRQFRMLTELHIRLIKIWARRPGEFKKEVGKQIRRASSFHGLNSGGSNFVQDSDDTEESTLV